MFLGNTFLVACTGDTRETDSFELHSTERAVMGEERGGGIHAQHKTSFHLLSNNKQWDFNRRLFVKESSVRSGESVIATLRLICARSNKGSHGAVHSHNTILRWVEHLRLKVNIMDKKAQGEV